MARRFVPRYPTGNKYHSHKVTVDGITFDSKKEARRYQELRLLEKAGKIRDLERQKKFVLIPAQYEISHEVISKGKNKGQMKRGKLIERECAYIADFAYTDVETGKYVVEDVKGYKGGGAYAIFKIKKKLMLYNHGIKIIEL